MRVPGWLLTVARMVRLQNAMMVLCAVLVSAYGASMYASLHRAHRQAIDDASGTLESIARSSEVGTNRSIFTIDAALLGVERMLETLLPETPLSDRTVKMLLNQLNDQTMVLRDILILDNDGRLLNKASWSARNPTRIIRASHFSLPTSRAVCLRCSSAGPSAAARPAPGRS